MRIILIKWFLYAFSLLPLPITHLLGNALGLGLHFFPGRTGKIARRNIALCLPELSHRQQQSLLDKYLRETAKTLLETGAVWLRPAAMILRLVREVDGLEYVEKAIADGRGAILATPHLGAWEVAGLYCAARFNISCLYRPLRMPGLEHLVNNARSRAGGNYLPANASGVRMLFKSLDQGGIVAMLPDQEPQAGTGVFAPFFGTSALTMVLLSRLAAKSGAPVIFVWCERLSWGRGFRLHFRIPPGEISSQDLDISAAAVNLAVENCIRECPSQYQWGYKRFRTRPPGEPAIY